MVCVTQEGWDTEVKSQCEHPDHMDLDCTIFLINLNEKTVRIESTQPCRRRASQFQR